MDNIESAATPRGRFLLGRVVGTSMVPALDVGCVVVIDRDGASAPVPGELVALRTNDGTVLHRVISSAPEGLITQGDNRPTCDGAPISSKSVVGRAVLSRGLNGAVCAPAPVIPHPWMRNRVGRLVRRLRQTLSIGAKSHVTMNKQFEVQKIGNEAAIHDRQSGAVHMLNATAFFIWESLAAGCSRAEILARLIGKYPQAPKESIESDLDEIITALRQKGLLANETTKESKANG